MMTKMKKNNDSNIVQDFITQLNKLQNHFEGDPYWQLIFSNGKTKWYYLNVSLYNEIYFVSQWIGDSANIDIHNNSELKEGQSIGIGANYVDTNYWHKILELAITNINSILVNPLKSYSSLQTSFPIKYRQGIIQKSLLWQFDKNLYRFDNDLSQEEINAYCQLVESRTFSEYSNTSIANFTANQYFELCKIAYVSSGIKLTTKQKKMQGRELYKQFADGRHEGLLDIGGDSAEEFSEWINQKHPKYKGGGHPWEILRGGNTTHISLYVSKNYYGNEKEFKISLAGHSHSRLCETIKIALGLYKKECIVSINDAELIRNRLLGQDFIGIVPEYLSLHRVQQQFETKLEDILYWRDIKTRKPQLIERVRWEQLPFNFPKVKAKI